MRLISVDRILLPLVQQTLQRKARKTFGESLTTWDEIKGKLTHNTEFIDGIIKEAQSKFPLVPRWRLRLVVERILK
jgi:hypothetical protein